MTEEKSAEVTFKYYLPEHSDDVFIHTHASDMYCLLWEIDQLCRTVCKYEEIPETDGRYKLAEEIRDMIRDGVDLDKIR